MTGITLRPGQRWRMSSTGLEPHPEGEWVRLNDAALAEQLRLVWNERGAADLAAMETAHVNYDWTELEDGIRGLDR